MLVRWTFLVKEYLVYCRWVQTLLAGSQAYILLLPSFSVIVDFTRLETLIKL